MASDVFATPRTAFRDARARVAVRKSVDPPGVSYTMKWNELAGELQAMSLAESVLLNDGVQIFERRACKPRKQAQSCVPGLQSAETVVVHRVYSMQPLHYGDLHLS